MSLSKEESRALLRKHSLRATAPRLAVLRVLSVAHGPLSNTEVIQRLGETDWDPATIYRNLIKLRDAGVVRLACRAKGLDHYSLALGGEDDHHHPHFVCDECGRVTCLPAEVTDSISLKGRWGTSVQAASVQFNGACPDCR